MDAKLGKADSLCTVERYSRTIGGIGHKCLICNGTSLLGSKSFEVDHLLGEGAFAHVYQASILGTQTQHNPKVILKVIFNLFMKRLWSLYRDLESMFFLFFFDTGTKACKALGVLHWYTDFTTD